MSQVAKTCRSENPAFCESAWLSWPNRLGTSPSKKKSLHLREYGIVGKVVTVFGTFHSRCAFRGDAPPLASFQLANLMHQYHKPCSCLTADRTLAYSAQIDIHFIPEDNLGWAYSLTQLHVIFYGTSDSPHHKVRSWACETAWNQRFAHVKGKQVAGKCKCATAIALQ